MWFFWLTAVMHACQYRGPVFLSQCNHFHFWNQDGERKERKLTSFFAMPTIGNVMSVGCLGLYPISRHAEELQSNFERDITKTRERYRMDTRLGYPKAWFPGHPTRKDSGARSTNCKKFPSDVTLPTGGPGDLGGERPSDRVSVGVGDGCGPAHN